MKNLFGIESRHLAVIALVSASPFAFSQAISVNGGSIQGSITDSTGAAIPKASVTISSADTGFKQSLQTDGSGVYSVGPVNPGAYTITVTAQGFEKLQVQTVVRTGTATSGNFKLTTGGANETIEVTEGAVQVNTEQIGVSNVINQQQFDQLPVNGRNFLAYAQLEPGVQLQNADSGAGGFDPTKAGYSALSFGGISGRTTRILLDGQDITDETVGSTIFNVTSGSVGEMQVNRATADPSVDITSTGSVIASTRSGTNSFHGQVFYNFQDERALFSSYQDEKLPFQRNQFGGEVGGPIIKDKLFFFANAERIKQDLSSASPIINGAGSLFTPIRTAFPSVSTPARDTYSTGRLDYNGPYGIHAFARVNYEVNSFATGGSSLYANRDNTPGIAGGVDVVTGRFTNSFRVSYEKFHNLITDATAGNASLYNPVPGFSINYSAQGLHTGPNDNAPQATYQSDKQFRYDGSTTYGKNNIRFGGNLNRILGGGFASFFGLGPYASISTSTLLPGGNPSDPLNGYHARYAYIGNGQGSFTEIPAFGSTSGGQGDWRLGFYINDSIKLTPTFTLSLGARYDRDTGRTDSDLDPIPCSAIDPTILNGQPAPCTGSSRLLDQFGAGLGAKINQPNKNVGPQIGFTYAPGVLNNKTVLRGGIGIYYETSVFNNVLFDRPGKLASGHFNNYTLVCLGGVYSINEPGKGQVTQTSTGIPIQTLCGEPLAQSAAGFIQLENDVKAASVGAALPNGNYVGNVLAVNNGNQFIAPNYRSPYSININFGIQQELFKGAVLSVDYVHNATLRIAQTIDSNHVGDAAYLNTTAAKNAIATTLANCGAASVTQAVSPGGCVAAGSGPNGNASITDFASNGLDSGASYLGGYPASYYLGTSSDQGAAFAGINPNVGQGLFQFPTGKSAYDGLQFNFKEQKAHPAPGIVNGNLEVSYAYSRLITSAAGGNSDQFFSPTAADYRNATQFIGYGSLDRTHILSFGGAATIAHGPQIAFIGHFESSTPVSLALDTAGGNPGEIFRTDVTGDGTTGDYLPGTNPGAYMRKVHPGSLNTTLTRYNTSQAGTITPAGQALIAAGLFTSDDLVAAAGVKPTLANVPQTRAFPVTAYRQVDTVITYPVHIPRLPETMKLEPGIAFYNVFNLANYGGPSGTVLTADDADQTGSVNSAYAGKDTLNNYRVARGIGTFSQGAPRQTEFQLKFDF